MYRGSSLVHGMCMMRASVPPRLEWNKKVITEYFLSDYFMEDRFVKEHDF